MDVEGDSTAENVPGVFESSSLRAKPISSLCSTPATAARDDVDDHEQRDDDDHSDSDDGDG
jgi:hypothetical protein